MQAPNKAGCQYLPTAPRSSRYQIDGQPGNRSQALTALLRAGMSREEARAILDAAKREAEELYFRDLVPTTIRYVGGPRGTQWAISDTDGRHHRFSADEMLRCLMLVGYTQRDALNHLDNIRRDG